MLKNGNNFYFKIAGMVGLDTMHMESLSGDSIEKMTEQQLAQVAPRISVFYRVTPRHKLCIIKVSSTFSDTREVANILYCKFRLFRQTAPL